MSDTGRLAKYHGLGNDFLVWLDPPVEPGADMARRLCDRHRGIGADGLITARSVATDPTLPSAGALLSFRLRNADGSEAEMSGNGMRTLAHAALDAGLVDVGRPFEVSTPAGRKRVDIHRAGATDAWITVDMGVATVVGEDQRCNVGHGHLLVDLGNPHVVVAGPDPATVDVATLGPRLERSDPAGRNVEFVTLGPGPDELTLRVWERGVGETEACGTGACAAAVAFGHWGRVGRSVTVHQPGGELAVTLGEGGTVSLTGPSERVAVIEVPPELVEAGGGR